MHTAKWAAVFVAVMTLAAAYLSPNHLLVFCDGAVLALAIRLFWPATDAPVLLLPFGLQWLAVAMKPIETFLTGQPLDSLGDMGQPLSDAAWLGLAGVSALGIGLWLGSLRKKIDWAGTLARDASAWRAGFVVPVSLALIVGGDALSAASPRAGPAVQMILAFGAAKEIGLFVMTYWCLKEGKARWILAATATVQVVMGLTGYFADFRETFLVLLVAGAAARPRLGSRDLLVMGGLFAAMLAVSVFWTAIKHDYRDYLNQGAHEQVVDRSLSERLHYVGRAADQFDPDQFRSGLRSLSARLSYIDYLALTLKHVPEVRPHEHGQRLKGALLNIVEPRIIFPDKPPTQNDTDVTNRYTGLRIRSNAAQGTSISIGYLAELYVDFGYVGATFAAFLIGLAGGLGFRAIRSFRGIPLFFSYGAAVTALIPFTLFETDLVRFLGSAITVFLGVVVLQRLVAPQALLAVARYDARFRSGKSSTGAALAHFP